MNYRFGRNPAKSLDFNKFFEKLKLLEEKHKIKLIIDEKDFDIVKTKSLPKPFKKGDTVKAKTVSVGRLPNEVLAVADNRVISLTNPKKQGFVNVSKITHKIDKNVIFEHAQE
ncbi:radical SAM protein, partial [Candidatus Woesearchaeota archaeon]|nr:radical SAM protein [Candidatus Woesearchaeota archaeon]